MKKMNKPERDLKQAQDNAAVLVAFLNNNCSKIHCSKLDVNRKKIPVWQKTHKNTFVGRRGVAGALSSVMGVTIKVALKKSQKYILIEPRYGQDSFRSTYVKLPSGNKSDNIFLDTTALLICDNPQCRYYALYEYDQIPETHITKGSKGKGNANRYSLNSINATPIPFHGSKGVFAEPGLEEGLILLIRKIGK